MSAAAARSHEPERLQLSLPPAPRGGDALSDRAVALLRNRASILGFLPKCTRKKNGQKGPRSARAKARPDDGWRRYAFLGDTAIDVFTLLLGDEYLDPRTLTSRTKLCFLADALGVTERAVQMALYDLEVIARFFGRLPVDRRAAREGGVLIQWGSFVSRGEFQELALAGAERLRRLEAEALAKGFRPDGLRVVRRRRSRPGKGGGLVGRAPREGEIQERSGATEQEGGFPSFSVILPLGSKLKADLGSGDAFQRARASAPGEGMCPPAQPAGERPACLPEAPPAQAAAACPTDSIPVGVARNTRAGAPEEHAVPAPPARLPAAPPGRDAGRESRGDESTGRAAPPRPVAASPLAEGRESTPPPPDASSGRPAAPRGAGDETPDGVALMRALIDGPDVPASMAHMRAPSLFPPPVARAVAAATTLATAPPLPGGAPTCSPGEDLLAPRGSSPPPDTRDGPGGGPGGGLAPPATGRGSPPDTPGALAEAVTALAELEDGDPETRARVRAALERVAVERARRGRS